MITQAIKNWLHKVFAWWPWKQSTPITYSHTGSPLSKGTAQEPVSRSTIDRIAPQPGITPRLSTIDEWPERVVQPYFPTAGEPKETPVPLPPPSTPPPGKSGEPMTNIGEVSQSQFLPPAPEQQLQFLHYLVKRGIVNEGFEEGKVPEQYRIE